MPLPYNPQKPYIRTNKLTGERFCLFTVQLKECLWPKLDQEARRRNRKPTTTVSEMLQEALLRKNKK